MRVRIEAVTHSFIDLEMELPIIGHIEFKWEDLATLTHRVVNKDTFDIVKEGFTSFESAENWVLEQNYTLVTE